MTTTTFGLRRALRATYDEAVARLPATLASEGFGVLTEIDIARTLDLKLGVPFRRYKIFGACNPPLAHQALQIDLAVGVMLPCNVVVYEGDDGHAVVLAVDPTTTIAAAGAPELSTLAQTVKAKLERAIGGLE